MPIDPKLYQQLLEIFRQELKEQHQVLISSLFAIESADAAERQNQLQILFRVAHNIKGAAKSVSLDAIATIAHSLEDKFTEWKAKNVTLKKADIDDCIKKADAMLSALNTHFSSSPFDDEILKIPLIKIENANTKADEFITYRLRFENWLKTMHECIHLMDDEQKILNKKDNTKATILLKPLSQLKLITENANQLIDGFSRSLQNLQDDLRNMRLIPIETILKPLERVVRELSSEMGKNISLTVLGKDIEIDKPILDRLKDPLQHLIRNAIDHGIETPEERKKCGKSENGNIKITVQHDSGKIKIIFQDDGKGISVDRIKSLVLEKKLAAKETLDKHNDTEILNYIFQSGFTSKLNVNELSGRGVGLDVVKTNIESIKGSVQVETQINIGTTFTLTLPLTMATTRGVFFTINDQQFMLPTLLLQALHEFNLTDIKSVDGEKTYLINDVPIPVKSLHKILSIPNKNEMQSNLLAILIRVSGNSLLILVDDIQNEHDCVIKPLPVPFDQNTLYIGVTLTDSGKAVPVLNPKILFQLASKQNETDIDTTPQMIEPDLIKRILVVDDSLTTRSLAVHSLSMAGYQVEGVSNGILAWEMLKKTPFDCVVTDIEMPIMDGFELTALIKSNEQLKSTTVVIVSAHETDEDKKKGLKLGADAYLLKSQFDTQSLINIIQRLL